MYCESCKPFVAETNTCTTLVSHYIVILYIDKINSHGKVIESQISRVKECNQGIKVTVVHQFHELGHPTVSILTLQKTTTHPLQSYIYYVKVWLTLKFALSIRRSVTSAAMERWREGY